MNAHSIRYGGYQTTSAIIDIKFLAHLSQITSITIEHHQTVKDKE